MKEDKSKKGLKIINLDNKENNSAKIKDKRAIEKDQTGKKSKTKNPKRIGKDKTALKSKTINVEEE